MLRFYHRVDDPWSHLLAQLLPDLLRTYDVALQCTTLPFPALDYAPRPALLRAHALRDAIHLSQHCELRFDSSGQPPDPAAVALANRRLLALGPQDDYLALASALGDALFRGEAPALQALCASGPLLAPAEAEALLGANQQQQLRAGHFNTGMLAFGGNWYWGVDRLVHLEHDLLVAGKRRPGASVGLLRHRPEAMPAGRTSAPPAVLDIDFFCTFRSPYAYVAAQRSFDLQTRYGVRVHPRLMLPMKMAGYAIPELKALYFRFDPAREALRHGVRFGNFCDPFGPGLERAMAMAPAAQDAGRLQPYILSVMQAVWADGLDLATDSGLRRATERAGVDWAQAADRIGDDRWRAAADATRQELEQLGQYAAPTYRLQDFVTWGQDRVWMLEREIRRRQAGATP